MKEEKKEAGIDRMNLIALLGIAAAAVMEVTGYYILGSPEATLTMLIVEVLLCTAAIAAWRSRMPWLNLIVAGAGFALGFITNYAETTAYNWGFWMQMGFGAASAILGIILMPVRKVRHRAFPAAETAFFFIVLLLSLTVWGNWTWKDKKMTGIARHTVWAVPEEFDSKEAAQQGMVEELRYMTKAYATDGRDVEKRALVYLPYGYSEDEQYNILYLMHGTGDDENYWLSTFSYNKTMLDNLIAGGDIAPLIVVTPTFYVEDDLKDTGLDPLTYSFREELRNDLMPAVESRYATFAATVDEEGFRSSRDHRAFAGLSRGAVTTLHSVFCGSLDLFSWFGAFSGSRTDASYFTETIQSEEFRDLPIHYLYVTSGTFDFALPRQLQDYEGLMLLEPRLKIGVNTDFDVFPMRYHSMGDWHLALYNLLQRIFTE